MTRGIVLLTVFAAMLFAALSYAHHEERTIQNAIQRLELALQGNGGRVP